jgi:hypothetical protein
MSKQIDALNKMFVEYLYHAFVPNLYQQEDNL